jgi:m7GpppX diphosphatase
MFITNRAIVSLPFACLSKELALSCLTDHFHLHIVNANQVGMMGMAVGQAHLLDDIISLVSLLRIPTDIYGPDFSIQLDMESPDGPGIFERMTLTYGLGDQHGLFEAMHATSE